MGTALVKAAPVEPRQAATRQTPSVRADSIATLEWRSPVGRPDQLSVVQAHDPCGCILQRNEVLSEAADAFEQDAERTAAAVSAPGLHGGRAPAIHRFSSGPMGSMESAPAAVAESLASPGRPLQTRLRREMEQRFGHDFSQVRVHTDAAAERSARDLNAFAYTVGSHVVFGPGAYDPATTAGRHLLAHELTHVIQQSSITGGLAVVQRNGPKRRKSPGALSPQEMWDKVLSKRGFESRVPPHAVREAEKRLKDARDALRQDPKNEDRQKEVRRLEGKLKTAIRNESERLTAEGDVEPDTRRPLGHGTKTVAAIQVVDHRNRQVAFALEEYDGTLHAEERCLKSIREQLKAKGIQPNKGDPGTRWKVLVVVDQSICDKRCQPALREFARDYSVNLNAIHAYYPERIESRPGQGKSPSHKTVSKTATQEGQKTGIPKDAPGTRVLAEGEAPAKRRGLKAAVKAATKSATRKAVAAARKAVRSKAAKAIRSTARKAARTTIRGLPIIGALLAYNAAKADVDELKKANQGLSNSDFGELPSPADLRREHVWPDNIDEERDWLEEHAVPTLLAMKAGHMTSDTRKAEGILNRALSDIAAHVEDLETAEAWNKAYADELRPTYEQVKERGEMAGHVMNEAFKQMEKFSRVPPVAETALLIHEGARTLMQTLGGLETQLSLAIRGYDDAAHALRQERRAAVELYNTWYSAFNSAARERWGVEEDLLGGTLEPPD